MNFFFGSAFSEAAPVPGLNNVGNTCFMNAVLQSLASVFSLQKYMEGLQFEEKESTLTYQLYNILSRLNSPEQKTFTPKLNANKQLLKLMNHEQQDAHELLQFVLTAIEEEYEKIYDRRTMMCPTLIRNVVKFNSQKNPFCGMMRSVLCVNCSKCGLAVSPTYQTFNTVSLRIPHKQTSLEELLEDFTSEEIVADVECPNCYIMRTKDKPNASKTAKDPSCKTYNARKRLSFTQLPKSLCLHLRRVVQGPSGAYKSSAHITFPSELDLSPYTTPESIAVGARKHRITNSMVESLLKINMFNSTFYPGIGPKEEAIEDDEEKEIESLATLAMKELGPSTHPTYSPLYRLVSVVVHSGSHMMGHYTVFRRMLSNTLDSQSTHLNRWLWISDEDVRMCTLPDVLKSQASLLFYERY
eukprot:TRINITY_DN10656_c0_g1_i1.p1 TRINITY_DN10656_c0_g1~~TRINITY_DN10656_c0_g1_i1.p1  ORF type:complete len:413 (-),score=83.67 TRINITY_DN10656_c0_g1_i1:139-1377(-)